MYAHAILLSHRIATMIGNPSDWGACPPDPVATLSKALTILHAIG